METVTRFAERQAGSVSAIPTPGPEVARTLSVTASYLLSEDGRKASLLAGYVSRIDTSLKRKDYPGAASALKSALS